MALAHQFPRLGVSLCLLVRRAGPSVLEGESPKDSGEGACNPTGRPKHACFGSGALQGGGERAPPPAAGGALRDRGRRPWLAAGEASPPDPTPNRASRGDGPECARSRSLGRQRTSLRDPSAAPVTAAGPAARPAPCPGAPANRRPRGAGPAAEAPPPPRHRS
uniref:skin secretory protein xP2-like n=1 Tax=Nyctereutes procyonoides TaxID=34880 RepID=UPI002444936F|nr:skin secretory protein xP2-like [Nyctereutes procyonoides]